MQKKITIVVPFWVDYIMQNNMVWTHDEHVFLDGVTHLAPTNFVRK